MSDSRSGDVVTYSVANAPAHVAVISLNRPEARNAVNGVVAIGLEAAIDRLESDHEAWVAVLAANTEGQTRPVFCAGADLKALSVGDGASLSTERGGFAGFVYRARRKPIVAAVDGLATAGGCELVLACDLVVAGTSSSFGLAEVKRGLVAGAGGLFRLPRSIGRSAAMEAILTGEPISAERAYQLGLVSRLAEPGGVLTEAMRLAGQIAANAPLAVWESRAVVAAASESGDDSMKAMSAAALGVVMSSEDIAEGLNAFIEKRPPVWKGR